MYGSLKRSLPKLTLAVVFLGVFGVFLGAVHVPAAGAADLVSLLTSRLGVTETQAAGGAGSLLQHAQTKMGAADFKQVSSALPDVGSLIAKAPEVSSGSSSGTSGLMGGATSLFGGSSGSSGGLGSMAGVASQFSSLGLSPEMIEKYVPVILEYANSEGGPQVMQLLKGALL